MPSPVDLTALIASLDAGFASITAAITANQSTVDLTDLTAEIKRVADALYVDPTTDTDSVAQVAFDANAQVASVIGVDSDGDNRVRVNPDTP